MKKTYIIPSIETYQIKMQGHLLDASVTVNETTDYNPSAPNAEILSREGRGFFD